MLSGPNVGEMYAVDQSSVIGRVPDVEMRLRDDDVSRRHAEFQVVGATVSLRDLGSRNGTFLNEQRLGSEAVVLNDGDKIKIGSTTILKFTYGDKLDERFQREMFDASRRDGLTKLFNKRYFLERLGPEISYARRHHLPLSLLLFDVDSFKALNDAHGHLAGDEVLAHLAQVSARSVRVEDVLARYGGEEFIILAGRVSSSAAAGCSASGSGRWWRTRP